jgi:hypothetical protein
VGEGGGHREVGVPRRRALSAPSHPTGQSRSVSP